MALKLYLLRHAETEFSRQDRYCGRVDAALTDVGREMAECFADAHARLPWRAVCASSRSRAVATAQPLATRAGRPVEREPGLDEIDHGAWQGLTKAEIAAADPLRYRRFLEDPTIGAPGGESVLAVRARVLDVVRRLEARFDDGNVLLVSHKTTLRVLIASVMGVELASYRDRIAQPVCGVSVIELGPEGPLLDKLGDLSHLPTWMRVHALGETERRIAAAAAAPADEDALVQQAV